MFQCDQTSAFTVPEIADAHNACNYQSDSPARCARYHASERMRSHIPYVLPSRMHRPTRSRLGGRGMIPDTTSPTWQSQSYLSRFDVHLNSDRLREAIVTSHISLLRITTGLSDINVLTHRQPIVVVPNTPSLVSPKGADYLFGSTAKMQPKFVYLKAVPMVKAIRASGVR